MSKQHYPYHYVKSCRTYDVREICEVFSRFSLHEQTLRAWMKIGLKTIDNGRPALIYGHDLKEFLKRKQSQNKCKLEFGQFFCMKCQNAVSVGERISIQQQKRVLRATGRCRVCSTITNKAFSIGDIPLIRKKFRMVDIAQLYDTAVSSDKTHLNDLSYDSSNESRQLELWA